ncbi:beta-adaptin, partial [Coemansia sp. RSA 2530]
PRKMMNAALQTNFARLQIMKRKVLAALRKGENYELKTELNSEYKERRKEAVRRVIANMTVGKDVSGLFTD